MTNRTLQRVLVTGGAGFIGSALIRQLIQETSCEVLNVDKLTYAGNLSSLRDVADSPRYHFSQTDICDVQGISRLFDSFRPDTVFHLAAESHVDRSIDGPLTFVQTNVAGTAVMLQSALQYWRTLSESAQEDFRFQHISTDEVFGALGPTGFFTEETPYDPRSPYSASKAASDHLVRAWRNTYGMPVLLTNCSNNYGPYHFPEKLVPLVILQALDGKNLPIYGKGDQIRDWLYVDDHARALRCVCERGIPGQTYVVGGHNERTNLQVVQTICSILDELRPDRLKELGLHHFDELITFVQDRPGHDKRYAIDPRKLREQLGWTPCESFETGIRKTVQWYLENEWWWGPIRAKKYAGERLGSASC